MFAWLLGSNLAVAAPPLDLDELVAIAVALDPETEGLGYRADSARSAADGAGRWMPPELMVGVDALGAAPDAPDPMMVMVGATQMFRGVGEARAWRERLALGATRAEADRARVEADLRARLWQLAAGIEARQAERALQDEQIRSAGALLEIGLARFGAGASGPTGGGMGGMGDEMPMSPSGARPPAVRPGAASPGAMPGMGGMGVGEASAGPSAPMAGGAMSSGSPPSAPMGGGAGLAALLRLDADLARLRADRAGLDAGLAGDLAVLTAFVGEEGAAAVAAAPERFLGGGGSAVPERLLAGIDRDAAEASAALSIAQRRPDFMVSVAERFMPEDAFMPAGTDVSVGVRLPLWGSQGRAIDAAHADAAAAGAEVARVDRDLAVANVGALAAWQAAKARADVLDVAALPRARQAWDAVQALYAADRATADDVVRAWESWIQTAREAVLARRDVELRAAELARLGGESP